MKLYKKTLIISIIVFLFCVLLSFVFGLTCIANYKIIQIITDYLIGIACSVIVVIITTFLQFKFEQRKILNSILADIHFFFFHCLLIAMSLDPNEETSSNFWEYYYDEIYKEAKKLSSELLDIEWFSKKKSRITSDLLIAVMQVSIDMVKFSDNKKDCLQSIVYSTSLKIIRDQSIKLVSSDDNKVKEIDKDYQEIQYELKKLSLIKNH